MIKPCGYRVLLKPEEVEEKTKGGIVIPEAIRDKDQFRQQISTVVAIGEFSFQDYPGQWYKVGDTVLTKEFPGICVKDRDSGESYRLVNDTDILAVL
jgi:chaperonin GroES